LRPYDLEEVLALLGEIAPYDWRSFFAERVDSVQPDAPVRGLEAAGWRLVYGPEPNIFMAGRQKSRHQIDWTASLGIRTNDEGKLTEVVQDSPAFAAGLTPGSKIVGIAGGSWSAKSLARALADAHAGSRPLILRVERQDEITTVQIRPARGAVYPHLERLPGTADRLDAILGSRAGGAPN
jgi:predicted metalloprotease with PDZ domain